MRVDSDSQRRESICASGLAAVVCVDVTFGTTFAASHSRPFVCDNALAMVAATVTGATGWDLGLGRKRASNPARAATDALAARHFSLDFVAGKSRQ